MRVLLTGARGWIGRYTAAKLLEDPEVELLGLGRSPPGPCFTHDFAGRPAPLPEDLAATMDSARHQELSINLLDPMLPSVVADFKPQLVLHLASAPHDADPATAEANTVRATAALVSTLERTDARLLVGSTGSLYGEPASLPQDESHPTRPASTYSRARLRAEERAAASSRPVLQARIFNVIGPGQPERFLPGSLASQLARILRGRSPPVLRLGLLQATRDYIDVRDVAEALVRLARSELVGPVNVGSGVETPVQRVFDGLLARARARGAPPIEVIQSADRPVQLSRQQAGVERLRGLGFRPCFDLDRSLSDLLDWAIQAV